MDSETLGEVGTPLQLGDEIHFLACALPRIIIAVVWKRDKMEFDQEIVKTILYLNCRNFILTVLKILLRINLENEEEAENFKNHYSVVSNTNWIVYGCTPNPQR
ncbi:hypothetical protein TNCV_2612871 [Trichonephila clavipes]|nr:hypothetical protein TNCV_2612871 [Trichonephila clavipes]